jgi:hypothetical protein
MRVETRFEPGLFSADFVAGAVLVIVLLLYVFSVAWAYGDAEARGKSGCLVAFLVTILSWPIGLIAWLAFRPNETQEEGERAARRRRSVALRCSCGARIRVNEEHAGSTLSCPSCGGKIAVPPLSQLLRMLAEDGSGE